jgi:hypothetical protein
VIKEPVITRWPAKELPAPFARARRLRDLTPSELRELLRAGPVQFLIVDVGRPLRQVEERACFEFWKSEVRPRLAHPEARRRLEDFQAIVPTLRPSGRTAARPSYFCLRVTDSKKVAWMEC